MTVCVSDVGVQHIPWAFAMIFFLNLSANSGLATASSCNASRIVCHVVGCLPFPCSHSESTSLMHSLGLFILLSAISSAFPGFRSRASEISLHSATTLSSSVLIAFRSSIPAQ